VKQTAFAARSSRLALPALVLALVPLLAAPACVVRTRHGVPLLVPPGPHVYVPAPRPHVYVAPPPVVIAPRPVYVAPPPAVVYAPGPAPAAPPPADYGGAPPPQQQPQQEQVTCIDPAERDISDRFDQAMPLAAVATTIACTYRGDVDMFVITAPPAGAGQIIQFSLRGYSQMAPIIDILNGNRAPLHREVGVASGEVRGWIHVAGGTPVYLRISQVHGVNEPYMLATTAVPLPEPGEPNGDIAHATMLSPGTPVQAFASAVANDPSALADWYRIDVAHDGDLMVDLDTSEGIIPMLDVYNANRRPLGRKVGARGERIQLITRVQRGTHYVVVSSPTAVPAAGGGALPPWLARPYTLTATVGR
jgi:hypothetical protein